MLRLNKTIKHLRRLINKNPKVQVRDIDNLDAFRNKRTIKQLIKCLQPSDYENVCSSVKYTLGKFCDSCIVVVLIGKLRIRILLCNIW